MRHALLLGLLCGLLVIPAKAHATSGFSDHRAAVDVAPASSTSVSADAGTSACVVNPVAVHVETVLPEYAAQERPAVAPVGRVLDARTRPPAKMLKPPNLHRTRGRSALNEVERVCLAASTPAAWTSPRLV